MQLFSLALFLEFSLKKKKHLITREPVHITLGERRPTQPPCLAQKPHGAARMQALWGIWRKREERRAEDLHRSAYVRIRQKTSENVKIRQHTSANVRIRQLTAPYVSILQYTSAYFSMRQHTSAYVSTCLHTSAYEKKDLVAVGEVPACVLAVEILHVVMS